MALAVVLVLVGLGAGVWYLLRGRTPTTSSPPASGRRQPTTEVPPWTFVALVGQPTPAYASPESTTPTQTIAPTWGGAPSALPVVGQRKDWSEVRLVERPSGTSTAWLKSSSVTFSRTPYHVVVDLGSTRVVLFERSRVVLCAPAGVGTADHPTPTGHFFVALLARSPSPAYGPFVLVTSAMADTVTDWQQSGVPVITVAGPLGSAPAIGRTGARVTTGGVRLLDQDLERLRPLPAGTPVDIASAVSLAPTARSTHCERRVPATTRAVGS